VNNLPKVATQLPMVRRTHDLNDCKSNTTAIPPCLIVCDKYEVLIEKVTNTSFESEKYEQF